MVVDPRPELTADSHLWVAVIKEAELHDPAFAGLLHGLRCCGCTLHRRENGSLRLDYRPALYADNGEQVMDEETLLRDWLNPWRDVATKIFAAVAERIQR